MAKPATIPITMLSGFLGAGKTTILRALLSQNKYKIGCVVNDVAAVNIDAKLIRNKTGGDQITSTADLAPTIELQNGCACCTIQDELFVSFEQILSLADKNGTKYDRIVLENSGVAEPQNIRDAFTEAAENGHPVLQRVHLSSLITVVDSHTFITEYACRNPVATRPDLGGDDSSFRPVVDLLVEQVEVADYVVLNKVDMLGEEHVPELREMMGVINPLCTVVACSHGKVDMDQLFGPQAVELMANLNTEGQHRGYVANVKNAAAEEHGHNHSSDEAACEHGKDCKDPSHHHHHHHEHGESCKEHGCSDPSHDHSHGHSHADKPAETTASKRFGITSFVYSRRRPFHPHRLREMVVQWMPVSQNKETGATAKPENNSSPIKTVMRSKGFMWLSSGHATAFYWSHAGMHFEIREEGDWWAAVPDAEWPTAAAPRKVILSDFSGRYGDRRQEIVFIGSSMNRTGIEEALDSALLTDDELAKYNDSWAKLPDPEHPVAV